MYTIEEQSDGRWAVKDASGKTRSIYNKCAAAKKEVHRLNKTPEDVAPDPMSCHLFDSPAGFLICSSCHSEIRAGAFYYVVHKKIVCASCQERTTETTEDLSPWG